MTLTICSIKDRELYVQHEMQEQGNMLHVRFRLHNAPCLCASPAQVDWLLLQTIRVIRDHRTALRPTCYVVIRKRLNQIPQLRCCYES